MDAITAFFTDLAGSIAGPKSRLWPVYLLITVGLCYIVYRRRRISTPFLAWLFPKSVYSHPSNRVDVKVFAFNTLLGALGLFNLVFLSATIAGSMVGKIPSPLALSPFNPVVIGALLLIITDFSTYWVHRLHHQIHLLWPFHALHHSAEVMTPLTVYRKHPIYDVISDLATGLLVGVLQGVFLVLFDQMPGYLTLVGVNLGYVLFHFAGSNIRHSHVWLSFGPRLEHIFISPAQHQIHHSLDPRHHNQNYGEVLAIWDWMFGTLYVTHEEEALEFGLADEEGNRLRQPHDSLRAALVVPLRDALTQWRRLRTRRRATPRQTAPQVTPQTTPDTPDPSTPPRTN
ncbi:sterol desaturase family protein [Celeribacter arenosi]|uniref:Sterol desaturase family protein n=1 Tax=Celeribacter arenosi TaxID=792649 RepID=A0ABP7K4P9_9RHOB